jgi:alpha-tubulin suppressor-like RCC1 family protein
MLDEDVRRDALVPRNAAVGRSAVLVSRGLSLAKRMVLDLARGESLWSRISPSDGHVLAIRRDGSLWTWGIDEYGEPRLGDPREVPVASRVGQATDWVWARSGWVDLAIKSDGSLWQWRRGADGGDECEQAEVMLVPEQVGSDLGWAEGCAWGDSLFGLKKDGSLWAWGENRDCALGLGDETDRPEPSRVGEDADWKQLCGCSVALKLDGSLWGWGRNRFGQLGQHPSDGKTTYPAPTKLDIPGEWSCASCDGRFVLAVRRDGSLWGWGDIGLPPRGPKEERLHLEPTLLLAGKGLVAVDGHRSCYAARSGDGGLWLWEAPPRRRPFGEGPHRLPLPIPARLDDDGDWAQAGCGYRSHFGLKRDGSLWAWGENEGGQLGLGDAGFEPRLAHQQGLPPCNQMASGSEHVLAIDEKGRLWAWGENRCGQLGLGDTSPRVEPVLVDDYSAWSWVSARGFLSAAIRADGTLWAWGRNDTGQLGVGDRDVRVSPSLVAEGTSWTQVNIGSLSGALAEDGSLWVWGDFYRPSPVQELRNLRLVPRRLYDEKWLSLSGGGGTLRALSAGGTIWDVCRHRRLMRAGRLVRPEGEHLDQVTSWAGWVQATRGGGSLAIRSDGTLWAWGDNELGQLGLGDVAPREEPTQVGCDSDWVEVKSASYATLALKADGSVWGWGTGVPGPMDALPRLSPVPIDKASSWAQVQPGTDRCFALRADGHLFWWGHAIGWDRRRPVPVQVTLPGR